MFLKIIISIYIISFIGYLILKSRLGFMRLYHHAILFFENIAYINVISGMIRVGKTIFLFACSHMMTLKIMRSISKRMREIERILIYVDFTHVIDLFESVNYLKLKERIYYVLSQLLEKDSINSYRFTYRLDDIHYDYLSNKLNSDLLKEYLALYYHSKRNDYIYSRVRVYNQITGTYSLFFDPEWMKIKGKYEYDKNQKKYIRTGDNDFPLDKYSVSLYDEMLLNSNNIKNSGKAEDNGTSEFLRLYGHIFEETSYFFGTAQNAKRIVKAEREISQQHIFIKKSYLVGDFPKTKKVLYFLEMINQTIYNFVKFLKKDKQFENQVNIFKRISKLFLKFENYFTSKGFILFNCNIYNNEDMVGKDIKPEDETISNYSIDLCLPVVYCWAVGDTHEFKGLLDKLSARSKLSRDSLGQAEIDFNDLDLDRILGIEPDEETSSTVEDDVQIIG